MVPPSMAIFFENVMDGTPSTSASCSGTVPV
jgi:hypothetical protein